MRTSKLLVAIAALSSVGLTGAAGRNRRLRTKLDNKDGDKIMEEEDVVFWTRLLQNGSLPGGGVSVFDVVL